VVATQRLDSTTTDTVSAVYLALEGALTIPYYDTDPFRGLWKQRPVGTAPTTRLAFTLRSGYGEIEIICSRHPKLLKRFEEAKRARET